MPEQHENILGAIDRHRSDEIGTGPFDLGRAGRRYPSKSGEELPSWRKHSAWKHLSTTA